MGKRIIGIDVARALAVIGMIIVNFKVVFGENGTSWIKYFVNIFEGKASAIFVVIAGVGLALMTKSALKNNDQVKLKIVRRKITKRALFLFLVGISYMLIWPADILHFYGAYLLISVLFLANKEKTILISGMAIILVYPLLMIFWSYETAWDFNTLHYQDLWTTEGFIRNLFFNGFHPVIPWMSFMLCGYWLGKQDLNNTKFVKRIFWTSAIIFIALQGLSYLSILILAEGNHELSKELTYIIGTQPMPPLPIYMLSGITIAVAIISACILISERFPNSKTIDALNKMGQLALTFYVAHVIIGMGIVEIISPRKMGNYPIQFSVIYAFLFSILCALFAVIWRKYNKYGPLEWLLRKLTN